MKEQYIYTYEDIGPMDGINISYVVRYLDMEKVKREIKNSDAILVSEEYALEKIGEQEWEEGDYVVISNPAN